MRAILLVLIVALAGCSGGGPLGDGTGTGVSPQSGPDCTAGFTGDIRDMPPQNLDGWVSGEVETLGTLESGDQSTFSGYERAIGANYTADDGRRFILVVTEWTTDDQASLVLENTRLWGAMATTGSYLLWVPADESMMDQATELVAAAPCVTSEDVVTKELNVTIVTPNVSTPTFNLSLNETTGLSDLATAEIDSIEHELGSDAKGTYLNVTVTGTFENTSLSVSVAGASWVILPDDLADGSGTAQVRLGSPPIGTRDYTVLVEADSPYVDSQETKQITVHGVDVSVSNVELDLEESFTGDYRVDRIQFDVDNAGGIGTPLTTIDIVVNGETATMVPYEYVNASSSIHIDSDEHPVFPPALEDGENTLTVRILVNGEVIAEDTSTVEP